MAAVLLDMDLGEQPGEPEALFELAQLACVACGGHAGDDASMERAVGLVARAGTELAAHPSYEDRSGFGRRSLGLPPRTVQDSVAAQCAALLRHATLAGLELRTVKPHGALYHDADADPALAVAVVGGARSALGARLTLVGPAGGALEAAARGLGARFLREALADRGSREDGSLIPRGEPGALLTEPAAVVANVRRLLAAGGVDALCLHGDGPNALELACELRALLARVVEP